MVFIAILFGLLFFFALIVQQWIGLLGYNIAIPLVNTGVLFILVIVLNYFHIGPKLMAYGLVSIVAYLIFLIWLLASAPSGSNSLPLFGTGAVSMASAMGQAYTIQAIFIPVLRELPDSKNYAKYTLYTYLIGTAIYFYIAYMGAYGMSNIIQVWLIEPLSKTRFRQYKGISILEIQKSWPSRSSIWFICIQPLDSFCSFPSMFWATQKAIFRNLQCQTICAGLNV